jgi:hypothetical protein
VLQRERDALVAERGELRAELSTLRRRMDAADKGQRPSPWHRRQRTRSPCPGPRDDGSSVKNSAASGSIDRCVPVSDVRFPLARLQRVNRGEESG